MVTLVSPSSHHCARRIYRSYDYAMDVQVPDDGSIPVANNLHAWNPPWRSAGENIRLLEAVSRDPMGKGIAYN